MQAIFTALFGPVFAKEMLELARRPRYFFVRGIFGLGIFFVLLITFQSYSWRLSQPSGANIHFMAEFAETMFRSVGITQFIALFAFVPMFLCGAVASEREENTLDLLFTTTLLDREIVLGKMLSRLVIFALLILMALPIFALISLFGGISPPALFRFAGAMLTALTYAGAYSMYYSTITKSPMGALLRTYWQLVLRLLILPYLLIFLVVSFNFMSTRQMVPYVLGYLCCTNPIAPLMIAVVPQMYEEVSLQAGRFGWPIGEWFFFFLMVIPLTRAGILIRRTMRKLRSTPAVARMTISRFLPGRRYRQALGRGAAARVQNFRSLPDRFLRVFPIRNPLWLRGRQCHCFDREGHLGRLQVWCWVVAGLFLLLVGISEYLHGVRVFRQAEIVVAFLTATYSTLAIFTTIVASISIVGDRRRGFFDLLLTTPLTSHEILDGTFLSVWAHLTRIAWLPVALAGLFLFSGAGRLIDLATSLALVSLFMTAASLVGIACSLCARSLMGSLVPTFVFVMAPNIGIAFLIPMFMRYAPFVLWFLCLTGLLVTSYGVRRKATPAAVGCYLLCIFQCIVTGAATSIAWRDSHDGSHLIFASMPSLLAFTVLSDRRTTLDSLPLAEWIRPCYLLGMLLFCLWARWWLNVHFETLSGRASNSARRPGSLAHGIAVVVRFFYWHIPEALRPRRRRAKLMSAAVEPVTGDAG